MTNGTLGKELFEEEWNYYVGNDYYADEKTFAGLRDWIDELVDYEGGGGGGDDNHEGDDGADDEGGPAQAQADEARLADDGATYTRAMALAMAGCDGPCDYCECCLVVLREDGFCEDCETWPTPRRGRTATHTMGGMKRAPGPAGRDSPGDEEAARKRRLRGTFGRPGARERGTWGHAPSRAGLTA